MNIQAKSSAAVASRKLPFEVVALVLQGGGALAAYQAGVFETLAEAGTAELDSQAFPSEPSTAIAGNPPMSSVDRLREFWTSVASDAP